MIPFGKKEVAAKAQRSDIIAGWIFATLWCGGTFPFFYLATFKSFHAVSAVLTGFLALCGVIMLWTVGSMTLDYLKFGVVAFTPRRETVRPGDQVAGLVEFLDNPPTSSEIEVELLCQHVTWSRGVRGSTVVSEETAWSARRNFPLRQTGSGASAAITFDIPSDARPTDLPGERPSKSGWIRIKLEQGKPLHYHRWEIRVIARVPGLDLERSFKVVVEPAAASRSVPAISDAAPTQRRKQILGWMAGPALVITLAAISFVDFSAIIGAARNTAPPPAAARPVVPPPPLPQLPLPPTTPWTTDTSGWTMPMPVFARYAGIAANGIHYTRANGQMRITFDEIVIEKNPAQGEIDYFDLIINVIYDEDSGRTRYRGGYSGQVAEDIRGKLTVGNPVLVLRNRSVVATTPQGNIENMRYHLTVNAVASDRKRVLEKSREISELKVPGSN